MRIMNLRPGDQLTDQEVSSGLRMVIGDGLATEAMTTLTGGAFLVALAVIMGASNFQIGLLAALPTFTNIFQLLSIWLVSRYNNRRAISVICALLARLPLVFIGLMPFLFPSTARIQALIFFLFFFYFFGSIAGPSWNSWMKDLVPENSLGAYFSKRSSYMQLLNVILSLVLALLIDHVKSAYPAYELSTYGLMFITAGVTGIVGALILSRAPEPQSYLPKENVFKLFGRPLRDGNFRSLLVFNSAWVLALNIATPFFTVYLIKGMGFSLSYIIGLGILSQLCSIFSVRMWGIFADRYSNKTIIAIVAPLYIFAIIAWCFVGIYTRFWANLALLAGIYMLTGLTSSGINLSLTNISLKLAHKEEAVVYLSAQNIITAFFSSLGPLIGGWLADYFMHRHLSVTTTWVGPKLQKTFRLVELHEWNFLFLIGALLALIALELLAQVKEKGEVEKEKVVRIMRSSIRNSLRDRVFIGNIMNMYEQLRALIREKSRWRQGTRNDEPVA